MKNYLKIIAAFFILSVIPIDGISQEVQGFAYYQSATDVRISDFEGRQMEKSQKEKFMQIMKDFFKKEYVLSFTKSESLYKQNIKLNHPMANAGLASKLGIFSNGPQYKNIATREFLQSQEFLGKRFLIKDELQKLNWNLTSETKKIGKYTCYKATAKKIINAIDWRSTTRGGQEKKELTESKEIIITAWFTTEIAINQGPSDFWGLPGLILEVNSDRTSIVCTKIIINPENTQKIEEEVLKKVNDFPYFTYVIYK